LNVQHPTSKIELRNGRRVVLKRLDEHCLLDGELHPSIRQRLSRVRELPMTAVANLHGVERADGGDVLIWDFVPGRTLDQLTEIERADVEADVRLVVARLHEHGIVHGAVHAGNIIIDERRGVHLTHVSPLLHNDPDDDLAALDRIFVDTSRRGQAQRRPGPFTLDSRALLGALLVLVIALLIVATAVIRS
jgi:hypothetical protein